MLMLAPLTAAHAQDVDAFMLRVANAWGREDAGAIAGYADRNGISLEVEGIHVGSVSPRQAAAVLRRVFGDRETLKVRAGDARMMRGSRDRAYAELVWERRARGTTQTERVNIFVAVALDAAGWHITEIRLMK